ncbi:prolyl oligopeptidase family serine peptidase [Blastopirellula sp. JC732]|uniref:Prolyl oligopeptidase family serine peptidase n=1 Tax=Blastopirellula sediminis TaxID=2894196 RepID=A0A9X1MKV4_9BACT|nr:prolyl oligopeptidase family serine peptidase [Blastopirellula sediminis]MCC9608390.1 prolyl oligopeptidase family serine peptidase [Blastopirellula sediminis]MCC9628833.1 prolyl oligopeptidase family serine peptidase [Blastopirellula sediminis]
MIQAADARRDYVEAEVVSSFDKTRQPLRYILPTGDGKAARPVLVFLHSWSTDYHLEQPEWVNAALQRGWIFMEPNFRGPNKRPEACGSEAAQADILDSVTFAIEKLNADPKRIYLAGASGGGHMSMLMAGRHPERFTAVSAWVGITDLAKWYEEHTVKGVPQNYAKMLAKSCGGAPGDSPQVDQEYQSRSPLTWITRIGDLPIDIAAGVHDGQTGSVPFQHSIRAYNKIAAQRGAAVVSEEEMQQLWDNSQLTSPHPQDTEVDSTYGRDLKLRRNAGTARITIFEGGHEGLAEAACACLEEYERPTKSSSAVNGAEKSGK